MKTYRYVSLLALAVAAPAFAQSNPGQPTVDENGETIVVTASRSGDAVPISEIGGSVTVLDAQALQTRQTRAVSDVLRDVPGVAVSRTGTMGGQTQIRMRGTEGNHVLVLIDGIKASDPYIGEYDFGTMIADESAKIEVLRGQQSALYGSDAIGGVVQYITLTGAEAPGITLRAEGGSFGTGAGGARAAGVIGQLDYAVSASYYHTDGTPNARNGVRNLANDSLGANAKLIWTPSDIFKITAVGRYSYTKADTNNTSSAPPPLFGLPVDSPGTYYDNNAFYGLVRADLSLMDGRWTTALTGQLADTKRLSYSSGAFSNGDKGQRYKGSLESAFRFDTGTVRHRVTGAVDYEREQFQTVSSSPFAFTGQRNTDNVGVVGEYNFVVDDALSVTGSIRHDFNNRFADVTTWRGQASYKFATGTRIRGAYGTGVKNPGYFELYGYSDGVYIGNPNLKPEKSKGWEVGFDQSFAGNKASIGATYFNSRLTDEIYTTFPAPLFIASPANRTTESTQEGIEFFLTARPIQQLRVDGAVTYLHARENGVVEVRRPDWIGSLNVTAFSRDERFEGTLTVRYNGRQQDVAFTDPSFIPVNVSLSEFVLVNLNAEYKLTDNIAVFGRVENLFAERYEEVFGYATAGRAAYGGVRVRL